MTFDEVDRLPLLIRRQDVQAITGWSDETMAAFVEQGTLSVVRLSGSRRGRYRKHEVLGQCGIAVDASGRVVRRQTCAAP